MMTTTLFYSVTKIRYLLHICNELWVLSLWETLWRCWLQNNCVKLLPWLSKLIPIGCHLNISVTISPKNVVVEFVVTRHGHHGTEGNSNRVKHLGSCIDPDLQLRCIKKKTFKSRSFWWSLQTLHQWFLTLMEVLNPTSFICAFTKPFFIWKIKCDFFVFSNSRHRYMFYCLLMGTKLRTGRVAFSSNLALFTLNSASALCSCIPHLHAA